MGIKTVKSIAALFVVSVASLLVPPAFGGSIRIGTINDVPTETIKTFKPLAVYLQRQLKTEGFIEGKVVVARDIPEMASFLREGKIDLFIDSPFPSVAVSRISGSKFLALRLKKGLRDYYSVFFARKDSSISRVEDLKGKMVAFKDAHSSSGYFLPKLILTEDGYKLAPKRDASETVKATEIGYVFAEDEDNIMFWVLKGKVSAGAMDNDSYLKKAGQSIDQLRILRKSFSVPRHIVNYRADLPRNLVGRIKAILIKMDQTDDGKKILLGFQNTTKFEELAEDAMAQILKADRFFATEPGLK